MDQQDKAVLDALAPPVETTGWAVVVTDAGGVVAVLGPHASELDANACRDVIRPGPEREVAVVPMRRATVHDIHDQVSRDDRMEVPPDCTCAEGWNGPVFGDHARGCAWAEWAEARGEEV